MTVDVRATLLRLASRGRAFSSTATTTTRARPIIQIIETPRIQHQQQPWYQSVDKRQSVTSNDADHSGGLRLAPLASPRGTTAPPSASETPADWLKTLPVDVTVVPSIVRPSSTFQSSLSPSDRRFFPFLHSMYGAMVMQPTQTLYYALSKHADLSAQVFDPIYESSPSYSKARFLTLYAWMAHTRYNELIAECDRSPLMKQHRKSMLASMRVFFELFWAELNDTDRNGSDSNDRDGSHYRARIWMRMKFYQQGLHSLRHVGDDTPLVAAVYCGLFPLHEAITSTLVDAVIALIKSEFATASQWRVEDVIKRGRVHWSSLSAISTNITIAPNAREYHWSTDGVRMAQSLFDAVHRPKPS